MFGLNVTKWRMDRTSIFLLVLVLLFLWDLAYFVGLRDPARSPHPFRIFTLLFGDSEHLLGVLRLLRLIIFLSVPGGLIGIGLGSLIHRSSWLTQTMLRFLRLGMWLPFVLIFAVPAWWILGIAAVMLCSCYHYLAARSFLGLHWHAALAHIGREAVLQALFISLLSQIWLGHWKWFEFAALFQPATGFGVLATLLILLFCINWIFRSNLELTASRRATSLTSELATRIGTLFSVSAALQWSV